MTTPGVDNVTIRPWRAGDDRVLAELLSDPETPSQHAARALLREPREEPPLVSLVAVVGDSGAEVVVAAGAIAASPAHPTRSWIHIEVAEPERRRGVGAALVSALVEAAEGIDGLSASLRARVAPDSGAAAFAASLGFADLFSTRIVEIDAGALGSAGADSLENLTVTETGSVALTKAFAAWYEQVNRLDPAAEMTLGQVNARFLSHAAGAHGAALWTVDGETAAFAVSYAQLSEDAEAELTAAAERASAAGVGQETPATELTAGSLNGSVDALRALLARLSADRAVVLEVTSEMDTEAGVVDALLADGRARVLQEYLTVTRD